MYVSRQSTTAHFIYIIITLSIRGLSCNKSKSLDIDTEETSLNASVPVNITVTGSVNAGSSLNTLKEMNDVTSKHDSVTRDVRHEDKLRTLIGIGQNVSDSSVPEGEIVKDIWTDVSILKLETLLSICDKGLWIPIAINETSLQLQACLKFVLLNKGLTKQNFGYVVNSSLLSGIDHTEKFVSEKYIQLEIYFSVNQSYQFWTLELQVMKGDANTYYWTALVLSGNIGYSYFREKNYKLKKYQTDLYSSYSCEFEDTIFLERDVAVVIKNLKYRAFRNENNIFEDEDIIHCPSAFWISTSVEIFICILILVTIVTIIRSCCKQKGKSGYRKFEHRFEP
ncbi:uncharacterized protein LOC123556647 [Mercenaria mercenaria]|uniref:uncharacterized protein LOC123556647 n=1 Tax=Mercenaria mercenaria TaxID=6596 RepID=UPI001E1D95A3|nr:uncharacterized protein LOC123556647 [Mercenaria mercenaria]